MSPDEPRAVQALHKSGTVRSGMPVEGGAILTVTLPPVEVTKLENGSLKFSGSAYSMGAVQRVLTDKGIPLENKSPRGTSSRVSFDISGTEHVREHVRIAIDELKKSKLISGGDARKLATPREAHIKTHVGPAPAPHAKA
ncbi:MAG: hypothetical protein M3O22_03955 [Pseudomonadota bacterium]|nr:hypothetical protein [Pseudomonadota bacterium]